MSNGTCEISMKKLGGQGSGCTNRKLMPNVQIILVLVSISPVNFSLASTLRLMEVSTHWLVSTHSKTDDVIIGQVLITIHNFDFDKNKEQYQHRISTLPPSQYKLYL